ncbi:MAG: hypothetical protein E6R05_02615 [Candidatus Moraniibacteriota bacterium]|nr:MAG: hypothetical protein E6R05_02615 [Candidatus Moranbacteria bacterium]
MIKPFPSSGRPILSPHAMGVEEKEFKSVRTEDEFKLLSPPHPCWETRRGWPMHGGVPLGLVSRERVAGGHCATLRVGKPRVAVFFGTFFVCTKKVEDKVKNSVFDLV